MTFLELSNEILLIIAECFEYESDINALSQVNHHLYALVSPHLHLQLLRNLPSPALEWAAEHGNEASVRRLLKVGVPPDMTHNQLWMPIMLAARNGHAETVQIFLEHGVDPNHKRGYLQDEKESWQGEGRPRILGNPLFEAIKGGHESVVQVLIEHGVDLKYCPEEVQLQLPLHFAASQGNLSLIKLLLESGCDPNAPNSVGDNALTCAYSADVEIARILIDAGAALSTSVLQMALRDGNLPLAKFFLEIGAGLSSLRGRCDIFSELATDHPKRPELAQLVLDQIDVDEEIKDCASFDLLMEGAASGGFEDLMKRLLQHMGPGDHLYVHDKRLAEPLERAVSHGQIGIMELLFEHSGNPDGDEYSTTLICLALEEGHDNVLKVLLDHGADIFLAQAQDDEADHLMDQIIKRGKLELIQAFLERDMSFQDTETSERPASIVEAARQGEAIFGLLLQHGIKLEPGRIEHQKALANAACQADVSILKSFLDAGFDVESRDPSPESGNPSLLAMVATANNREAAETAMGLLLARGIDIEALEPKTQLTSLLYLCSRMSPNLCRARNDHLRLKALGVRLLLDKGANLLFKNKHNTSAFILAAHGGDRSIVKIMLGFWEEQGLPFDWIKDHVLMGTSTNDPEMAKLLWHYYWPHVYPVEK